MSVAKILYGFIKVISQRKYFPLEILVEKYRLKLKKILAIKNSEFQKFQNTITDFFYIY